MHAYTLTTKKPWAKALPIHKQVRGFFCRYCKQSVTVIIDAPVDDKGNIPFSFG